MNKDECIHCNGKGYNGLDACKGCYKMSADEFHKMFTKHQTRASDGEYHIEFVEDVFSVVTDQLMSNGVSVNNIRAAVIHYLDRAYGKEELE